MVDEYGREVPETPGTQQPGLMDKLASFAQTPMGQTLLQTLGTGLMAQSPHIFRPMIPQFAQAGMQNVQRMGQERQQAQSAGALAKVATDAESLAQKGDLQGAMNSIGAILQKPPGGLQAAEIMALTKLHGQYAQQLQRMNLMRQFMGQGAMTPSAGGAPQPQAQPGGAGQPAGPPGMGTSQNPNIQAAQGPSPGASPPGPHGGQIVGTDINPLQLVGALIGSNADPKEVTAFLTAYKELMPNLIAEKMEDGRVVIFDKTGRQPTSIIDSQGKFTALSPGQSLTHSKVGPGGQPQASILATAPQEHVVGPGQQIMRSPGTTGAPGAPAVPASPQVPERGPMLTPEMAAFMPKGVDVNLPIDQIRKQYGDGVVKNAETARKQQERQIAVDASVAGAVAGIKAKRELDADQPANVVMHGLQGMMNKKTFETLAPSWREWEANKDQYAYGIPHADLTTIKYLSTALPAIKAAKVLLPEILANSAGAATWAQAVSNWAKTAAGSTDRLARFNALMVTLNIEAVRGFSGSSRPAVQMMEGLKKNALPNYRTVLEAGLADMEILGAELTNRIKSLAGLPQDDIPTKPAKVGPKSGLKLVQP